MSDNNINPDPKDPLRNDPSVNNPGEEAKPNEISDEKKPLNAENLPDDTDLQSEIPAEEEIQIEKNIPDEIKVPSEASEEKVEFAGKIVPEDEIQNTVPDEENTFDSGNEEGKINEENIPPDLSQADDQIKSESELEENIPAEIKNEEPEPLPVFKPLSNLKSKESNYQISLINENLLKILVTSKRGVKINSSAKENKSLLETQNNEIYFNPVSDFGLQEVEVLIAIDEDPASADEETKSTDIENQEIPVEENDDNVKSNYLINLINENLLKIKILTTRGVRIDSIAKDKKNFAHAQSHKIYLNQKPEHEQQKIEITIEIDSVTNDPKGELLFATEDGKVKLIPNPEVMDLIQPPDYSPFITGEEPYRDEDTSYKNPFDALRKLIRKNLAIGLTAAVILHLAAAGFAYFNLSKKSKEAAPEEQSRLIVIQDLPDPKIKLEDVEDPNKPKVEPVVPELENKEPNREIPPRRIIKPPVVTRPKRDMEETKLDSLTEAELNRGLDSLRRLREELLLLDSNLASNDSTVSDSTKSDSIKAAYEIPDSLRNNFNENDIGLAMYFPKSWKLTDQREINKNEKEFKGVVLTDTTAEQPGTMTMFIFLDNENKDYNAEDFKTEYKMNDSNLTAFSKEPKTLAGFTEYRFYIFNKLGTEKLSLRASVRKQFFDQYKNEIEAVVRSIRIKKKEDL